MTIRFLAPMLALLACVAFLTPAPAQARMAAPGLSDALPGATEQVQYRRDRRHYRHRHYQRHRHCWTERVRVRNHRGHVVVRHIRRCGWR